jgi:hypothetical protein
MQPSPLLLVFILSAAFLIPSASARKLPLRAIDAFNQAGLQEAKTSDTLADGKVYSWELSGIKKGPVSAQIQYASTSSEPSTAVFEYGSGRKEMTLKNTGLDQKGKPKFLSLDLGTFELDPTFKPTLRGLTNDKSAAEFKQIMLSGEALSSAKVQTYSLNYSERSAVTVTDYGIPHNTLTPEEKNAGWELLFNGKDTNGWSAYRGDKLPPAWIVQDGTLYLDKASKRKGGNIIQANKYRNFELIIEWKLQPKGNSGIMLRAHENKRQPWETAIEIQVADPKKHTQLFTAGAAYGLFSREPSPAKPIGEWNRARIMVKDNHYQVWLNEVPTADFVVGSSEWEQAYDKSKWTGYPGLGENEEGHIVLQDHGNPVWYRNLKIRSL